MKFLLRFGETRTVWETVRGIRSSVGREAERAGTRVSQRGRRLDEVRRIN